MRLNGFNAREAVPALIFHILANDHLVLGRVRLVAGRDMRLLIRKRAAIFATDLDFANAQVALLVADELRLPVFGLLQWNLNCPALLSPR